MLPGLFYVQAGIAGLLDNVRMNNNQLNPRGIPLLFPASKR